MTWQNAARFAALDQHQPAPIPRDPSDRRGYIGGSEIAAVLSLEPYGCARRLWYRKTDATPDREFRATGVMETGTWLEDHIADRTAEQTGWSLRRRSPIKGADHEGAHIDRHIVSFDERGPGVLEVKCVGRETFWKWKFDGVSLGYLLQLQWYMYLTGWKWGAIAAWNRDHEGDGRVMIYPFDLDEALSVQIAERVEEFWETVLQRTPPPPLSPRDHRCEGCEYGPTCKSEEWANVGGEERRDDLVQIVEAYDEARAIAKEAEALKDARHLDLLRAIGDTEVLYSGDFKVSAKVRNGERIDTKRLRNEFPEICKQVMVASDPTRPLLVTRKK